MNDIIHRALSSACVPARLELPISSLGLRMDDGTFQVAVGLRVGSSLSRPHSCHHCGTEVDHLALHGLSCREVLADTIVMLP